MTVSTVYQCETIQEAETAYLVMIELECNQGKCVEINMSTMTITVIEAERDGRQRTIIQ